MNSSLFNKTPKTQKAQSIAAIENYTGGSFPWTLIQEEMECKSAAILWQKARYAEECFLRPCPKFAQHGFVDSRAVRIKGRSSEEIEADFLTVFNEARDADPSAEVIVMPLLTSSYSACLTPVSLAIGPGNDAATSGHNCLTFGVHQANVSLGLLTDSGVPSKEGDVPYLEMVEHKGRTELVQVRSGPAVPRTPDFIPVPMVVKRIVEAVGTLTEWKKIAESLSGEEGVVVAHYPGGTMGSHYGAHCLEHRVAIMTSRNPVIGEFLEQAGQDFSKTIPSDVGRWISLCLDSDWCNQVGGSRYLDSIHQMLFGAHNYAFCVPEVASRTLGAGIAAALRLGTIAVLGELRHYRPGKRKLQRQTVYYRYWNRTLLGRSRLSKAVNAFNDKAAWEGSFGGEKWRECAQLTIDLWNASTDLAHDPTDETVLKAATALHDLVNAAHNNGWMFNKFANSSEFDSAATGDFLFYRASARAMFALTQANIPDLNSGLLKLRKLRGLKPAKPLLKPGESIRCDYHLLGWQIARVYNSEYLFSTQLVLGKTIRKFDKDMSQITPANISVGYITKLVHSSNLPVPLLLSVNNNLHSDLNTSCAGTDRLYCNVDLGGEYPLLFQDNGDGSPITLLPLPEDQKFNINIHMPDHDVAIPTELIMGKVLGDSLNLTSPIQLKDITGGFSRAELLAELIKINKETPHVQE